MKSDPFLVDRPALLSFSGGLTSAYMLWRTLQAHGGDLPAELHVCFANTGKEREETLEFVRDCAEHWGVRVRWLEWRPPGGPRFAEVDFESADREGRWFAELIRRKQYLPNPIMRYCTIELKIRVMRDFMIAQGYQAWDNLVGLRADEMHRVFKAIERNEAGKERFRTMMPLADARVRLGDVREFWDRQNFRLRLAPHEGNCDLCFLKRRDARAAIIRANPQLAPWWIEREDTAKCSNPDGARFRKDESYRQLAHAVAASPLLPFEVDDAEFDAECGLTCAGDDG